MAIYETDIKLLESQRLTDNPDGGGRLTGNEVVDGEANNLFPDISQLDLTYGRNNLRKGYMAAMSPNTDTYYGAHVILTKPPSNPNVHACLFDTGSWTDVRADARSRVESYVISGTEWPGFVWGSHLEGQSTIRILQRLEVELPEPNQTLLVVSDEGGSAERSQYVRVTDVSDSERTFTDGSGNSYTRREVIVTVSQPLRDDHPGHEASRDRSSGDATKLRRTQVADAARYFGIRALEAPASDGDLQVDVGQIFTPLVPATQAEEAVTDQQAGATVAVQVASGGETVEVFDTALTYRTEVELANRQQTYVQTLVPAPAPGTLTVDYRSQGQWYRLEDNGEGNLTGTGAGSIDYETGTVQATLGELPDVGTAIIYTWGGAGGQFVDASGQSWATITAPEFQLDLVDAVQPGTLSISYVSGGTTYTLTDDGSGALTGDGSGSIIYTYRYPPDGSTVPPRIWFVLDNQPDPGSTIQIDADAPTEETETHSPDADGEGVVAFTLTGADFQQGGISFSWQVQRSKEWSERKGSTGETASGEDSRTVTRTASDDGNGNVVRDGSTIGSIDYSTGAVSFTALEPYSFTRRRQVDTYSLNTEPTYETEEVTEEETLAGNVKVSYATNTPPSGAGWQQTLQADERGVEVNLLGLNTQYQFMPGTLRFTWGGATYGDDDGELVRAPDSGSPSPAGTINYSTGEARIDNLPDDTTGNIEITRGVVLDGAISTDGAFFRTPGPQRPGSLVVQAVAADGTELTAQAGTDNTISGDGVSGEVDPETGIVQLDFGQQVMPGTITFSTVAYSYIPLDADILGLDPVRLPQDGRVPFVRPGDVAVVHNTQTTDMGDGSTSTDLGRTRLSYIHVYDANGDRVPDADVIADLDAGTVEVDQSTDSPAPFSAEHRIEDMLLVSEAQITGIVSFARQLTHDYPAGDTYLSTALLIGDLQARVYNLFSQESWNDEWSDDPTSDGTTASYNEVQYPIQVTNDGAIEERWALYFQTTTTVDVIGEYTGQVLTGASIDQVIAPTNPETGEPYFSIPPEGWGGGWATGNLLRFNTSAANYPLWIARTILAGEVEDANDEFRIQIRGDAN